ncbi:hypothetical protein F5883DRAFT_689242 [Diaporthe sp. PMI_573]|nr:hypothetical protein F5883DRAFT_689242 [Diaporthaceae sp. PMI_573]
MSTSIKSTKTHTAATNAKSGVNISRPKTIPVLDIIRRTIQSELQPDKKQYVLCGQDGESPRYRAEFAFKGDLRTYLKLQNQASGEKKKFSSLISFTSACVGPDALAIPVSVYVRDTWGQNGIKILQMIGNAVGKTESRKDFATLTQNCQVWITVNDDNLHLTIEGTRSSFVGVLEQICWFVSVAGDTAIDRLKNYVEETKQGTTTREYTETVYTGRPVIRPGHGCCLNVSFRAAEIEKRASRVLVEDSGHCWKTMTGLSIVASGFAIPPRPRNGSGLDASLPVLRQLIKRGCRGASPLALDKPMVVFHPRKVDRIDKSDQGSAIKLRYILAAGFEQPLRKRGNVIYWHFDPAKVCNSLGSLEQLEKRIRVEPSAIDPNSRHFVGWTSRAGHLAAMLADRQQKLHHVTARLFVLWDKHLQRGWLVGGDTVALYLFRRYAKKTEDPKLKNFDFMSLKNLGYSGSSAYKVLAELNAKAFEAEKKKAEKEKKKTEKEKKKTEKEKKKTEKEKTEEEEKEEAQEEKEEKESIGPYLDEIYALALELTEKTPELNKTHALSTPFQMWFDRKFSTTITGADFDELTGNQSPPRVYTYKMKKDPGWIKWTKEEGVTFVFASGLGEVMEPKAGSCCPHFPTLPAGENLLASELRVLKRLITKYAADGSCFPPDKTVARLSHNQGWERRSDPFLREKCHGDHLNVKLLKGKALYTVKEINDMIDKNPDGVVVFGRQPGPEELGDISRRSRQRIFGPALQPWLWLGIDRSTTTANTRHRAKPYRPVLVIISAENAQHEQHEEH